MIRRMPAPSTSRVRLVTNHHKPWWILSVLAPLLACGCQKVLFPQNEPRTQYQRADTLRDRFTPLQEPDVFGNPKPALRSRLAPSSSSG
jgi:hypothetical protein